MPYELYRPGGGVGRAGVFFRDIEMVSESDLVLALFPESDPMEGGTAHVVEKAQDQRVPVYAYTVDDDLKLHRLGEWDADEAWSHTVPGG